MSPVCIPHHRDTKSSLGSGAPESFARRITQLPSPLAKVSLEESIHLFLARRPHSSQNMPALIVAGRSFALLYRFFLSHENRKLLAACLSWLPGNVLSKPSENQMVERQRRYALFALGMMDVTVGSLVVAVLIVRDNSMHLSSLSATQISSSSSSGLRLRK